MIITRKELNDLCWRIFNKAEQRKSYLYYFTKRERAKGSRFPVEMFLDTIRDNTPKPFKYSDSLHSWFGSYGMPVNRSVNHGLPFEELEYQTLEDICLEKANQKKQ